MLFNIYLGTVIFSFVLLVLIMLSTFFRVRRLSGYKHYKETDKDTFKDIASWLVIILVCVIPIINLLLCITVYNKSDDIFEDVKKKINNC